MLVALENLKGDFINMNSWDYLMTFDYYIEYYL